MSRKQIKESLESGFVAMPTLVDVTIAKGYVHGMPLELQKGTSWAQLYELAASYHGIADFRTLTPSASEKRQIVTASLCMLASVKHSLSQPDYNVRLRHLNSHLNSCIKGYHKGTRNA